MAERHTAEDAFGIGTSRHRSRLTTSIHIPPSTLELLKIAAFREAQKSGKRFSVSGFLTRFIERHRGELEQG
jgi:hypothetical protein